MKLECFDTSIREIPNADLVDLGRLLRMRAKMQGGETAYSFLARGEVVESLTYEELDCRSRAIAATLRKWSLTGERALLLYPPGLDFISAFLGCVYAGVVAVPSQPPHRIRLTRFLPRLRAISADAALGAVLTTAAMQEMLPVWSTQVPELRQVPWLVTDKVDPKGGICADFAAVDPSDIVFIQYTSGSTSSPKGVMVSHANLIHNLSCIHYCEENDSSSVSLSWLPPYHDMGLIEGLLQPLFGGYPAFLMKPSSCLQSPFLWLEAISRFKVTNSGAPDFAYQHCVRKINGAQRRDLDLSSWRVAYSGSEPVRSATIEAFSRAFGECGFREEAFYPVYGLAESTLVVSSGRRKDSPMVLRLAGDSLLKNRVRSSDGTITRETKLLGCGPPVPDTVVAVTSPETLAPCKSGEIGELWIAGPSVARGYWNKPEETQRIFRAYQATGEGPFLRTGDLGFIWQGQVVVTGRLKSVIIIRGQNHYPQDLEDTIERCHTAIRTGGCAAYSVQTVQGEGLAVMAEIEPRFLRRKKSGPSIETLQHRESGLEAVVGSIRQALSEQHQVHASIISLVSPGSIPKTSSGKLRRYACQGLLESGELCELKRWELRLAFNPDRESKALQLA